jgi:hypothetical protein
MRIARPILLVTTPFGVAFGLREAWRIAGPGLAVLMAAMITVVAALLWMTVRRIRSEQNQGTFAFSKKQRSVSPDEGAGFEEQNVP